MNRKFIPPFLNKLDKWLMLNRPLLWSTRIHFVAYFGLLFILAIITFRFLTVPDFRQYSNNGVKVGFIVLISFVAFIIWIIYLLRFNVFKKFGIEGKAAGIKSFFYYLICCSLFVFPAFIITIMDNCMVNTKYNSTQMVKDLNKVDDVLFRQHFAELDHPWNKIYYKIVKENKIIADNRVEVVDSTTGAIIPKPLTYDESGIPGYQYQNVLKLDAKKIISDADSVVIKSDSVFIIYQTPNYKLVNNLNYYTIDKFKYNTLSNRNLYDKYKNKEIKKPTAQELYDVNNILNYYSNPFPNYYYYPANETSNVAYDILRTRYNITAFEEGISNINSAQYQNPFYNPDYFRLFYYFSMSLALLVFIYRHSTTRAFFLSLVSTIVLAIFTGLCLSLIKFGTGISEENLLLTMMLIYFSIFTIFALKIFSDKTRKIIHGISLNIFTFFLFLIPLIIYQFSIANERYDVYDSSLMTNKETIRYYYIAEIIGFILLVILLEPLIKKLYRKWYSLPES